MLCQYTYSIYLHIYKKIFVFFSTNQMFLLLSVKIMNMRNQTGCDYCTQSFFCYINNFKLNKIHNIYYIN